MPENHNNDTMLCKYGKQTRDFGGVFTFSEFFYILGAFLIKQLFHSRLLDMRLVIAITGLLPTRPYGPRAYLPSLIQRALME